MKSTKRMRRTRFVAVGTLATAFSFGACSTDRNQQPREELATLQEAVSTGDQSVGTPSCSQSTSGENIVHTFSTQVACEQDPCVLQQTATLNQTTGNATATIIVSRRGQAILSIATQTLNGSTQVTVDYGQEFKGIHHASLINDGQLITGTIDGRSIVPLPAGADPSTATFQDGKPPPDVKVSENIEKAIGLLFRTAQQQASSCAPPTPAIAPGEIALLADPGHESHPETSPECLTCALACSSGTAFCLAAAALACLASGPFFALCFVPAAVICTGVFITCQSICLNDVCCPVDCGSACCFGDETCLNPALHLCCSPGQTTCDQTLCCDATEFCTADINNVPICCPQGGETCGTGCCGEFARCNPTTQTCCPDFTTVCGGDCCDAMVGEQCINNECCPQVRSCGTMCCGPTELCVGGMCVFSGCAPPDVQCIPDIGAPICCPSGTGECGYLLGVPTCCTDPNNPTFCPGEGCRGSPMECVL